MQTIGDTLMKPKISVFNSAALSGAVVVFACLTGINPCAQAADQLWIGSAGNYDVTTGSNWVGGAPSVDSWSPFVFGSDVVDGTMNLNRWVAISSITVNSGCTHNIAISGGGPIIMGGGLVDMSAAGVDLTCSAQFQQGWGDMTFNVGAGRTLTAAGGVGEAGWFGLHTGLTKDGAGTMALSGALGYTLGTTVNGGTLAMADGDWIFGNPWGASGGDGLIAVNAGATFSTSAGTSAIKNGLTLNGGTVSSRGLNYPGAGNWGNLYLGGFSIISAGGSAVSTVSSALAMSTTNTVFVDAGSTLNVTGPVYNGPGGAGSLTKTGNGMLAFSGFLGFTGGISVNGGTVQMPSGGWNLNAIATYPITVNAGATLQLPADPSAYNVGPTLNGGTITSIGDNTSGWPNITLVPGATITAGGAAVSTISTWVGFSGNGTFSVGSGSTLNITGRLTGDWIEARTGVIKTDVGTLTLSSAANNYDCGTTISGGTLAIGGAGQLNGGNYGYTITNNAVLVYGSSAAQTLSGAISGTGSLTQNGSGTLTLSGANTYSGETTINGGTLALGGAGQLGGGSYSGEITNNAAFVYGSSAAQTLSGAISGTGSITQSGAGTLALSGNNTYTGPTIVNGGTLQYNNAAAAGNTSKITVNNGGSLYIDWWAQGGTISAPIELNGWGDGHGALWSYVEGSQFTFSGPVTLLGNSQIQGFAGNSTLNFTHAIGGTGNLTFYANGASPNHKDFMVLSGASTFSGDLYIESYAACSQVTLSGGENRLPTNTVVHIAAGKWAQDASNPDLMTSSSLDLNGCNQTLAGLSDSGVSSLLGARSVVNTSGTMATLTLNTSANQLFSGTIGGTNINGMAGNNLSLVKSGIATQTLASVNTYIGSTAVSNGVLKVTQMLPSGTDVHVATGAKLELAFEGTCTVRRLYVGGVLQERNKVYSSTNRRQALAGAGSLYVGAEGAAPHGTLIIFF